MKVKVTCPICGWTAYIEDSIGKVPDDIPPGGFSNRSSFAIDCPNCGMRIRRHKEEWLPVETNCPVCGWKANTIEFPRYYPLWLVHSCPKCEAHIAQCWQCAKWIPIDKFYKRGFVIDNHVRKEQKYNHRCPQCVKENNKMYDEAYNYAGDKVAAAIRRGELQPIQEKKCIRCGAQAIDYHHYKDYEEDNILEVVPVCRKCHFLIEGTKWELVVPTTCDALPLP